MLNFYDFVKQDAKYINHENALIKHPARMLIIGASGTGKTNCLMNIINHMNVFEKFYIFARMQGNDPLYDDYLIPHLQTKEKKHEVNILQIYSNSLDDLPPVTDIDDSRQNLIIFDDMINQDKKDQKKISDYFCMGRKKNCTVVYISQNYYSIPKIIRGNVNVICISQIVSRKDKQAVHNDINRGDEFEEFDRKCDYVKKQKGILMIVDNCYYINPDLS
jgi:ABC-type dipeptide/oligopeptide/nickel transport system ATPase subunit